MEAASAAAARETGKSVAETGGDKALKGGEVGAAFEGREAGPDLDPSAESLDTEAMASQLDQIAESEGWSVQEIHGQVDEALSLNPSETEGLIGSDGEITDWVRPEEKAHYDAIGLQPESVAGREALVRGDINWDQADNYDRTNLERAQDGLAPLDPDGNAYELHHVQQRNDGVLAELRMSEHRSADIDRLLHDKVGPSEIDRDTFGDTDRPNHWKARAAAEQARRGEA